MALTADQILAAQKANLETLFGLTTKAFEGVEKLVELNVTASKAALSEAASTTQAMLSVKDAQELLALQASLFQPLAEKTAAYSRHLYDIAQGTGAEFGKAFESKAAEAQQALRRPGRQRRQERTRRFGNRRRRDEERRGRRQQRLRIGAEGRQAGFRRRRSQLPGRPEHGRQRRQDAPRRPLRASAERTRRVLPSRLRTLTARPSGCRRAPSPVGAFVVLGHAGAFRRPDGAASIIAAPTNTSGDIQMQIEGKVFHRHRRRIGPGRRHGAHAGRERRQGGDRRHAGRQGRSRGARDRRRLRASAT